MKRIFKGSAIVGSVILVVFAFVLALTWPPFTGFEEELTGLEFQAIELLAFDETGARGEGQKIWIYQLPDDAANHLANSDRIDQYPMWCGLALDGYRRLKWTPVVNSKSETVNVLIDTVFTETIHGDLGLVDVQDLDGAIRLASSLTQNEETQIAGWYYQQGDWSAGYRISKYFVYIINTEKKLLIKISLLT